MTAGNGLQPHGNTMKRPPQTLASLQAFYKLGLKVQNYMKKKGGSAGRGAYGGGLVIQFSDEHGLPRHEVYRALRFAKEYNVKEFAALCQLKSKSGKHLTKSHFVELITTCPGQDRDEFARKAARQEWSVPRLKREIRLVHRPTIKRGNRPPLAQTMEEALTLLDSETARWIRWSFELFLNEDAEALSEKESKRVSFKTLPPKLRQEIQAAQAAMETVRASSARYLARQQRSPKGPVTSSRPAAARSRHRDASLKSRSLVRV